MFRSSRRSALGRATQSVSQRRRLFLEQLEDRRVMTSVVYDYGPAGASHDEDAEGAIQFHVYRDSGTAAIVVNYALSGTAKIIDESSEDDRDEQLDPGDFYVSGTFGQIALPANESFGWVTLTLDDDYAFEGDQTVTFHLLPGSGYTVGYAGENTHVIRDDDPLRWFWSLFCSCPCTCPARTDAAPDGGATTKAKLSDWLPHLVNRSRATDLPIFQMANSFAPEVAAADAIEVFVSMGGETTDSLWFDPAGLSSDDGYLFAVPFDAGVLNPGLYSFTISIVVYDGFTTDTRTFSGQTFVEQPAAGPFGGGWVIDGLDSLQIETGGINVKLADGNRLPFFEVGGQFVSQAGDPFGATLVQNLDDTYTLTDKFGLITTFSEAGLVISREDRNGNVTTYAYTDADGDMQVDDIDTITDPAGRAMAFDYVGGLVDSVTDHAGRVTTLDYDLSGRLVKITQPDPDGAGGDDPPETEFTYDAAGRVATHTRPTGGTTTLTYDDYGMLLTKTSGGVTETYASAFTAAVIDTSGGYASDTDPATLIDRDNAYGTFDNPDSGTASFQVEAHGQVTRQIDDFGHVTTFERDLAGRLIARTDPDPDGAGPQSAPVTRFDYDAAGNQIEIEHPDGSTEEWTYDLDLNLPLTYTDPLGNLTVFEYDTAGNLTLLQSVFGEIDDEFNEETDDVVTEMTYTPAPTLSGDPPAGLLASVTDPLGRLTEYEYNERGLVTLVTFAVGTALEASIQYVYHATTDLLIETIDELGRSTELEYDDLGRLVLTILPDPDGAGSLASPEIAYEYNADSRVAVEIDPLGRETSYTYGSRGQVTSITRPDHDGDTNLTVTDFDFDDAGRQTAVTDPLGRITTSVYNTLGWLTESILPDPDGPPDGLGGGLLTSPTIEFDYDALGRLIEQIDPLGNITTYAYANFGREVTITLPDPDGGGSLISPEITREYDAGANLISETDPLGAETTYEYDSLNRLISVTLPDPDGAGSQTSPVTEYEYDKASNLRFITDPLGNVTEYVYDARNRRITEILPDPDGAGSLTSPQTAYAYDDAGQLTSVTDPLGRITSYEYDALGRMITVTLPDPDGAGGQAAPETTYAYDAASRLVSVTDALGNVTQYAYDVLDHQITVTLPDPDGAGSLTSPVSEYEYDAAGQLLSLTDPVLNVTAWEYDNVGRVIEETNELAEIRTFKYDANSNLIERVDRLGRKIVFEYDGLNRNTAEKWYDGSTLVRTLNFAYDAASQLVSASDPAAAYDFEHDLQGRVTSQVQTLEGLTFDIEYQSQFDPNSRRTELLAILDGTADFENTYSYDNLNRLTGLTQQGTAGGNEVAEKRFDFAYTATSQLANITRYADISGFEFVATSFYSYDNMGRLLKLTHNESTTPASGWGNNPLAGYDFTYDTASRMTAIDSYVDDLSEFAYDHTNQLIGADHTAQTDESYAYDENGNRTMSGYDTDPNNQLGSDGTYDFTYDDEGNRLTKTRISNGEKEELTWDHRNRLTNVTFKNNGGTVTKEVEFAYDAFNRLIRRTIDPDGATGSAALVDSFFSWHDDQINLEFNGNAAADLVQRNVWNPAVIDHIMAVEDVNSLLSAGDIKWPFTDHLGTPRDLASYDSGTDETTIENHRIFESFGQLVTQTNGSFTVNIGFTGVFFEATIGYNYHRARWLDVRTGRWVSEDPIGFASGDGNLVRYAENSPLIYVDPSGFSSAEGHHWTPLNIIAKLYKQGVLTENEYHYLAGRYSGPLRDGSANVGWSNEHRCYDTAVETQLRDWAAAKRARKTKLKVSDVVDNIKSGKSWNGTKTIPEINDFNKNIAGHTIDKTIDTVTDTKKVESRGITSLKGRKYLVALGLIAGAAQLAQRASQARDIARILTEGDAMCRAIGAAKEGRGADVKLALIEVAGKDPSVYDELRDVDQLFALAFFNIVKSEFPD